MDSRKIRRAVKQFRKAYGIKAVTCPAMVSAFKSEGFTVIPYDNALTDHDVATVVHAFSLVDMVHQTNGFIFVNDTHRLVFLNKDLTDEEKLIILSHEQGHYFLGHASKGSVFGRDVCDEFEASEFVHYLLTPGINERAKSIIAKHRALIVAAVMLCGAAGFGAFTLKSYHGRQLYEGEYYVTMHGEKYHLKNCVTIQEHETRRLTKEDILNGTYSPCSVCQPDK